MKIVGFDELKSTISIKFASDLAEKPIDDYEAHLFNVVELDRDVDDIVILKALANAGQDIALQQEIAEQTAKDSKMVAKYKGYVGKELVFTANELFNIGPSIPAEDQPISVGLMVI